MRAIGPENRSHEADPDVESKCTDSGVAEFVAARLALDH